MDPRLLVAASEPEDMLTDYMGIPLKRAEVQAILEKAKKHLKKSPNRIATYANDVIKTRHPGMVGKVFYTGEDFL